MIKFKGSISKIIDETHDVKTFRIKSPNDFRFVAGQYCMVSLIGKDKFKGVRKPFTFTNSPDIKNSVDLTIKSMGDFTQALFTLEEGDDIEISGPCGKKLNFDKSLNKDIGFLAGGTGITPFMCDLRYALENNLKNKFYLFYGNQTEKDIIFHDELSQISRKNKNITVIDTLANPSEGWAGESGFITKGLVKKYVKDPKEVIWFICGPPAMNSAMLDMLKRMDIPDENVKIDPWEMPGKSSD